MARLGGDSREMREALSLYQSSEQVAQRIALDQVDTREVTDGIACPDCGAPAGVPCFGPDARSSHQRREIAYYDARLWARVRLDRAAA